MGAGWGTIYKAELGRKKSEGCAGGDSSGLIQAAVFGRGSFVCG
jgi:hypothetical protein